MQVHTTDTGGGDLEARITAFYDRAVREVYRYFHRATAGDSRLTEDLTQETFMACVRAAQQGLPDATTMPWLMGVARHKPIDHHRRRTREDRKLSLAWSADPIAESTRDVDVTDAEALIVGSGTSIFLATEGQGLLRFDDSGSLVATVDDVGYSFVLGIAAGSVWVPDYDTGEVIRIDLATNEIVARTRVAGINAHSVFATDTSVWVTTYAAGNIQVIDPATNEMTAQIHATRVPLSVEVVGAAVWIAGGGQLNSFVAAPG